MKQEKIGQMEKYSTKLGFRNLWGLLWIFPLLAPTVYVMLTASIIVSIIFWIRRLIQKYLLKKKKNLDIVRRIQDDLGVDFAYFRYTPKKNKKSIIGGFIVPLLPFFVRVRSKKSFIEAAIHENYHIWWMVFGFQTAFAYGLMALSAKYKSPWLIGSLFIFGWLLLQEYLAFKLTRKYAVKHGFKVREFDKGVLKKYAVFYGSFVLAIYFLRPLKQAKLSLYILALVLVIVALDKIWYYFFKKWGWIKQEGEVQ